MTALPNGQVSNDPDGLGCYSDHAEDIRTHGECAMCTSTDPEVVGHVLPDTPRFKGMDPIDACHLVLETQTGSLMDGIFLDHYSASAVVQIYAALSPENQQRLRTWPLVKVVDTCFRLINNQPKEVAP